LGCPQGKTLKFVKKWKRPAKGGQLHYRSRPQDCFERPLRKKCIKTKSSYRTATISLYKEQMEKAKPINQTPAFKPAQKRCKTVIERGIVLLKNLGLKIRLWGLKKANIQGLLSALAYNVLFAGSCGKAVKKIKSWLKAQGAVCTPPFIPKCLSKVFRTYSVFKETAQTVFVLTSIGYHTQGTQK